MATCCPWCGETVLPVVTMYETETNGQYVSKPDEQRGLHCPNCEYRFAETNEVYLDEHSR